MLKIKIISHAPKCTVVSVVLVLQHATTHTIWDRKEQKKQKNFNQCEIKGYNFNPLNSDRHDIKLETIICNKFSTSFV